MPNVYGPYKVTFVGPAVWAAITDELPFELVDKEVWVTTTPPPYVVTDKMVEAGLQHYSEGGCSGLSDHERREVVRAILEAAFL